VRRIAPASPFTAEPEHIMVSFRLAALALLAPAAFALILVSTPAAAGEPLTLARVQALALQQQPLLDAQTAAVHAAREQSAADGQLPDPRLKLALQNLPVEALSLNRDPMTQSMISLEQVIPGGNKRQLRRSRGEAEAAQMSAELLAQRAMVARDAALAFLSLVGAQRQLDIARALSLESATQLATLQPALRAGRTSQADYFAARQMVTMAHHRESEIAAQAGRARAELSRWIGAAADDAPVDTAPVQSAAPPPLAALRSRLDAHPLHAASASAVRLAEAELALAREAAQPDKSIEIGYGKRARAFDDMITIQFAMEIPLSPRERQDRASAARGALREDRLRSTRAELGAVYADWESVGERLRLVVGEHLPDSQARVEAAMAAYRSGRGEMAAVIEARRNELEARMLQVDLETQLAKLRMQIAYYESVAGQPIGEVR
jgi:outer membrane protein TolC